MTLELAMPKLSDSMDEGTILRWHRAPGEAVRRGEELVEVETDKATVAYEAEFDGTLREILVPEGGTAAVGAPIARFEVAGSEPRRASARPPANLAASTRARATPVARRAARELGVELHGLAGTGPGGRIVRADVRRAATAAPREAPSPAGAASARGDVRVVKLTATQQTIARRMSESRSSIPSFTVTMEVDASGLVRTQRELRDVLPEAPPSLNDLVVRAVASTLREEPRFNAAFVGGAVHEYQRINVGVAVAIDDALVVPAVVDADTKSVAEIARETRALVERARQGALGPDELTAGTFTVSNLGMFGVLRFEAIVNPPQVAILAVGAASLRPAVDGDGRLVVAERMELTLSSDHRAVYGADAARFLRRVRDRLEHPAGLLVEPGRPG